MMLHILVVASRGRGQIGTSLESSNGFGAGVKDIVAAVGCFHFEYEDFWLAWDLVVLRPKNVELFLTVCMYKRVLNRTIFPGSLSRLKAGCGMYQVSES